MRGNIMEFSEVVAPRRLPRIPKVVGTIIQIVVCAAAAIWLTAAADVALIHIMDRIGVS
jgi:hypothetical protein